MYINWVSEGRVKFNNKKVLSYFIITHIQMEAFNIRKFDINKVRGKVGTYPTCVFVGKRNTGKTGYIQDILYQLRDCNKVDVCVREETDVERYSPMIAQDNVKVTYKSVGDFVTRQTAVCASDVSEEDKHAVLVLDDCIESHISFKYEPLRNVCINSRHLKTNLIIAMQHPIKLQLEMCRNIDYVFICRTAVINERQAIYKQFAGMFPSFSSFCQVLDACTNNYECLVIDHQTSSMNIEDMIFWYRAAPHEDFIMGKDSPANYRTVIFNPEYNTEDDLESLESEGDSEEGTVIFNPEYNTEDDLESLESEGDSEEAVDDENAEV
jgi:hypothetical protein